MTPYGRPFPYRVWTANDLTSGVKVGVRKKGLFVPIPREFGLSFRWFDELWRRLGLASSLKDWIFLCRIR